MYSINLSDKITTETIKYMGEMMAICALKSFSSHSAGTTFDNLYKGLLKDISRLDDVKYTLSDGYDLAQTAICFLCEHFGKTINDELYTDKHGKIITIKRACLRAVARDINRKLMYSFRSVNIDDLHGLETSEKPELETTDADYIEVDKTIERMGLTDRQKNALECRINGMSYPEAGRLLSMGTTTVFDIIAKIRKIYMSTISQVACK